SAILAVSVAETGLIAAASGASALLALAGGLVERHHVAAQQRQLRLAGQLAFEPVELLTEIGDVLERAVHRGEAHEADVVELAQFRDHELAHAPRRQLALGGHAQLMHHRPHRRLDLLLGHRALVQRAVHAGAQLARVEWVAPPGALDDDRQPERDRLQRAEALAAGLALATPPDRRAVVGRARIDDLGVLVLAEGAVHQSGSNASGSRNTLRTPMSLQRSGAYCSRCAVETAAAAK